MAAAGPQLQWAWQQTAELPLRACTRILDSIAQSRSVLEKAQPQGRTGPWTAQLATTHRAQCRKVLT